MIYLNYDFEGRNALGSKFACSNFETGIKIAFSVFIVVNSLALLKTKSIIFLILVMEIKNKAPYL